MARVWERSKQEGSALVLMLALANHANHDSICWPKVKVLADEARLKERQVQSLIKSLGEQGEIEVRHDIKGRGRPNYYLVTVGDADIQWPAGGAYAGLHLYSNKGAAECTNLPEKVQSSVVIGAVQRKRKVQSSVGREEKVQSSVVIGAVQRHALKESEPSIEPSLIPPSEDSDVTAPEDLSVFHVELAGLPGYEPSEPFFRQVLAKYSELDLTEEAMGIRSWMDSPNVKFKGQSPRAAGKTCNSLFIFGWLRRSLKKLREEATASNGTTGHLPGSGRYSQRNHL